MCTRGAKAIAWNQALPLPRNSFFTALLLRGRGSAWFQATKATRLIVSEPNGDASIDRFTPSVLLSIFCANTRSCALILNDWRRENVVLSARRGR